MRENKGFDEKLFFSICEKYGITKEEDDNICHYRINDKDKAGYMDISRIDDWDNLSIIDDDGNATYVYDVGELPRSDVVEREKYDLLQSEYETLKHQLEKSWDRIDELDKLNGNMRDKIDKAILYMKREQNSEFWNSSFRDGVDYALELLKKNLGIGESEL